MCAAEVLSLRFNENGNFIRAWGRMDETFSPIGNGTAQTDNMCIVDCMMNLPLLYWASNESGNQKYRDIAVRHANMVMKYFIRPDHSLWHAYRFNPQTGAPMGPENFCGRGALHPVLQGARGQLVRDSKYSVEHGEWQYIKNDRR